MRRFGLIIVYLVFLGVIAPALLVFNLQSTLFSSTTPLKKSLVDTRAYDRLLSFGADDIAPLLSKDEDESQISEDQIQEILKSISPETLRQVIEQAIDAYFTALKNGSSNIGINISAIKAQAFKNIPAEIKAEVDKSVPDLYQIEISSRNSRIWRFVLAPNSKYYLSGAIICLFALALLLGKGWKGKLRSLAGLVLIAGIASLISYYALKLLPISELARLTDNSSSQKLLSLIDDILQQLISPLSTIYRSQWIGAFSIAFVLFLITWFVPGRRAPVASAVSAQVASTPVNPPPSVDVTPPNPVESIASPQAKQE